MLWYFGICAFIIAAVFVEDLIKFITSIPRRTARGVEHTIHAMSHGFQPNTMIVDRWEYRLAQWGVKKFDVYANWLDHQLHTYRHTGRHRLDPKRTGAGRQTDVGYLGYLVEIPEPGADEEWADTLHGLNLEGVGSRGRNNM